MTTPSDLYTLNIGGLHCFIYNHATALAQNLPVAVLVATHGRGGSQGDLADICEGVLKRSKEGSEAGEAGRALIIVTLDQRNHGTRLINDNANEGLRMNPYHPADMWTTYRGTAADISGLVDVLPAYLFPNDERVVEDYFVLGVSLGGHAAWVTLTSDPRITLGIPIIGCPSYTSLMTDRITTHTSKSSFSPSSPQPVFPKSLQQIITTTSPDSAPYTSLGKENPFLGKRILVLCGAEDTLVPAEFTAPMFEGLEVGTEGRKQMVVEEGAGHEVTPEMIRLSGEWIWAQGLATVTSSKL